MTDINNETFEAICKKYNLRYGYAYSTSSYYIGFADLDYHNRFCWCGWWIFV